MWLISIYKSQNHSCLSYFTCCVLPCYLLHLSSFTCLHIFKSTQHLLPSTSFHFHLWITKIQISNPLIQRCSTTNFIIIPSHGGKHVWQPWTIRSIWFINNPYDFESRSNWKNITNPSQIWFMKTWIEFFNFVFENSNRNVNWTFNVFTKCDLASNLTIWHRGKQLLHTLKYS